MHHLPLLLEELEKLPALPWAMDHCTSLNTGIHSKSLEIFQLEAAAIHVAGLQHKAQCCISVIASCRKRLVVSLPGHWEWLPDCAK